MTRESSDETPPTPDPLSVLGARQAAVLEVLWQVREASVREVTERLRAGGAELAYTTVLTLLSRLHRRGFLARRREGRANLYRPAVERDDVAAALSREAIDRLLEGHGEVAGGSSPLEARVDALLDGGAPPLRPRRSSGAQRWAQRSWRPSPAGSRSGRQRSTPPPADADGPRREPGDGALHPRAGDRAAPHLASVRVVLGNAIRSRRAARRPNG